MENSIKVVKANYSVTLRVFLLKPNYYSESVPKFTTTTVMIYALTTIPVIKDYFDILIIETEQRNKHYADLTSL